MSDARKTTKVFPMKFKDKVDSLSIPGWTEVSCPEPGCDGENLHPIRVSVNSGGSVTEITSEGTKMFLVDPEDQQRGVVIQIEFLGECGHESHVTYRFHKGVTHRISVYDGQTVCDENGYPIEHETIWRD